MKTILKVIPKFVVKHFALTLFSALTISFASQSASADPASTHGMLLFGNKVAYASHLPMFHQPHDYQLILKLELSEENSSQTLELYEQAKLSGSTLFTLLPETMDLSKIIDGTKKSFQALIFEGHFERNGTQLGEVAVKVQKIIFSQKLNGDQDPSNVQDYFIFGETPEYFAAHIIKRKPNFDAILQIKKPFKLTMSGCNGGNAPIPEHTTVFDSELPVKISKANGSNELLLPEPGDLLGKTFKIQSQVKKVIYIEENELSH